MNAESHDAGPELARRLAEVFRTAGHELFLVGGAVRDELLGQTDVDLDFATSAHPPVTLELLGRLALGQPYRVGEKFGTIALRVGEHTLEVTTYRAQEVYPPGSRKPEVRFGQTLEEDLTRRDFTINAMARDPLSCQLIDPLGGRRDLSTGVIRAVGNAADRFREDPLRLLRAVRLASRLGFTIERETWNALRLTAPTLSDISRERIRDEYSRILTGPNPVGGLALLRDGGLMAHSVPQLLELDRMPDHGPRHPLSLWDHTMRVVATVPPLLALRWAALLHDIAKPSTRTHEPSGRPRFFYHEEIGADMARRILGSLRYSNALVAAVTLLIETHMQLHAYNSGWSPGAVRRLMARLGPLTEESIFLARADAAGHSPDGISANAPKFDELEQRIRTLAEGVPEPASPLSGDDLMERYGRPPGPWIRRIKDTLLDEVMEGRLPPDDREAAWRIADELVSAET